MSFNGAGVFTIDTFGNPVVADTEISSTVHNATMAEIAAALSLCLTRDGQSTVSANLPLNTKRITGLGAGVALNDAASLFNLIYNTGRYVGTVGGTVDAITLTAPTTVNTYQAGQEFLFIAAGTNTGAVTVNISGLGVKSLTKNGATALTAGDIASGAVIRIVYDGTRFQKV